ncbi:hypothetical protein DKX38_029999 [Salix brachista]|uniref:S-locus receptor kinase C-terminal domain-containing protein n=1 Tax=Salix brachista TaxID=2182728 RepID=A0A5N5J102_9ROSI|nr:hypothetical protein DKX38_029999 [Salix brachista]
MFDFLPTNPDGSPLLSCGITSFWLNTFFLLAWRLWKEEKVLDFMDRALCETCDANEFVRCVNVGLLCVQEHPWDRPTMSSVALLLGSDTASLPAPNKPAFAASRSLFDTASSSSPADSYVDLTNTLEQGR